MLMCGIAHAQQIDYNQQIKNKPKQLGFPAPSDNIQFVSPNGNDLNDGLSWVTAKLTCSAAIAALGTSVTSMIYESPALSGSDCIAATGSATKVNGYIWAPARFYIGPQAQATVLTTGVDSGKLRMSGSIWCTTCTPAQAVDDFWDFQVNSFPGAFNQGSNLIISHSSIEGGAGRILSLSDLVVANPRAATAALNSNSFAFDNQGNYFDGGATAMLWEMANTVNCDGCPLANTIFRQNWIPIFESSGAGAQAEYALGGSGTLSVSGNYAGPPKWLWTNLRGSSFNTMTLEHAATAPRQITFPDATGTLFLLQGTAGQVQFNNGADANFFWDNTNKRLGIGTSLPAFPLDVNGRINAASAYVYNGTVASAGKYLKSDGANGYRDSSGAASGTGSPATCAANQFVTTFTLNSDAAPASTCGHPAIIWPGSDSTTAVQINRADGSTNVIDIDTTNSRVGIGTTAPSVPFDVKTTGSGGYPQQVIENTATGGASFFYGVTDSGNGAGGGKYEIGPTSSSGAALFTIDSNTGNVGINQTSPAKTLDVNGSANVSRSIYTGLNIVTFTATPNFDFNQGTTQLITLTANVTSSTFSGGAAGQMVNFIICQNANGNFTFAWPTGFHGTMTIGATASKCSAQPFVAKDTSNYYATSAGVTNE